MKRLFLGSVALVALGLGTPAAFAAELRAPAYTPPPPAPPAYTWSGCYIGGGGGYSTGRATQYTAPGAVVTPVAPGFRPGAVPAGVNITDQFNLSGFIGTGELGCNWQWGAWVFGIEGDGSATNKEGQAFETFLVPFLGAGRGAWVAETQERWLVTARARLGLTNFWWFGPQTMVYVTGGGAWAKIDTSEFLPGQFATTSGHLESNTRSGWTVGGGLEYAVGYGWSVKSEFLYVKFDDYTTFTTAPFAVSPAGNISPRTVKLEDYIWRAGLNYKFW
jgi:outer membrane immunogenic protein